MPRVLVVEDQEINRRVLAGQLAQLGLEVAMVLDGAQAVELALGGGFDLVLMDVHLPVLDGYEATRRLRAAGFRQPIIAITAGAMAGEEVRCRAAGMDGALIKPVRLAELQAALQGHVAVATPTPRPTALPRLDGHRWNELRQQAAATDPTLVEDLARGFLDQAPRQLGGIVAALAAGDAVEARRILHRLASQAGTLGLGRLAALLREAEIEEEAGGPAWMAVAGETPASLQVLREVLAAQ